jgi:hypothetical protein
MRRFVSTLILLLFCLALRPATPASAGLLDSFFSNTLVTIDGTSYTKEDFERWWKFWQEPKQPLPKTPDPYIDWLLLAREGKRMQLDEDPGFKRQTRVFLLSRTLFMLKNDAVDSHVSVSDADVKARYQEKYVPRWLVEKLEFKDEAAAKAAWEELAKGSVTIEELLARDPEKGGPLKSRENWLRPGGIDPGWAAIFSKMKAGQVVDPGETKGGSSLFYMKEQKGSDDEDFGKVREDIRKDLWKEQENALTAALLQDLRRKYQVVVDTERIEALDVNAADDTFTDEVVISSTKRKVTEREFMGIIRKLMANRPMFAHAATDSEQAQKLKVQATGDIIAQSLTDWESLDRHYEKKEPFKWEYEFNYDHRLVLAVEKRLFLHPEAKITDEEVEKYYKANIDRYTQPSLVQVNIVEESQGPIDKVWAEVMRGKEFNKAVKDYFEIPVITQEIPVNHLDPEIKAMVDKLAVGETSPVFNAQGTRVLVHLVDRTLAAPLPLERVKETIRSQVEDEKMQQERKAYLEKLKSRSEIEVQERKWQAIQKELGGA